MSGKKTKKAPLRVLCLGEGNLSFSLSLCKRMKDSSGMHLIATTFDSESTISTKYHETKGILARLKRMENDHLRVDVRHDFDATRNYRDQLCKYDADFEDQERVFDVIIFNFPHLGIEDAAAHGCMVAHTFHEAKKVLTADTGWFLLALANAQHERWRVREHAQRNALHLAHTIDFQSCCWPAYEVKRHVNGKTFERRVDKCSHFCYSMQAHVTRSNELLDMMLASEVAISEPPAKRRQICSPTPQKEDGSPKQLVESGNKKKEQPQKKRKKKMHDSTDGFWACESSLGAPVWRCLRCNRTFTLEYAVVSHCYNVHVLATDRISDEKGSICRICEPSRSFTSESALGAHVTAAHGRHEVLAPQWSSTTTAATSSQKKSASIEYNCSICMKAFRTQEERVRHEKEGFQPVDAADSYVSMHCSCGKSFRELRALYQHQNHCKGERVAELPNSDNWSQFDYGDLPNFEDGREVQKGFPLNTLTPLQVRNAIDVLKVHIQNKRIVRMRKVLANRTDIVRFVFENPANVNNTWAALRTLDSMGLQTVDIILGEYPDEQRRSQMKLSLGTQKWMSVQRHSSTEDCLRALKAQGFAIFVTDIHRDAIPISEAKFSSIIEAGKKIAIVLGNEKQGVSSQATELADTRIFLPMQGFAESLNVSAFCAFLCGHLYCSGILGRAQGSDANGDIGADLLLLKWMAADVPHSETLLQTFLNKT